MLVLWNWVVKVLDSTTKNMFCYERGVRSENAHTSVWRAIKTIHSGVDLENSLCTSHGDSWTRISISIQYSSTFTVRMSNWNTSVLFFLLLTVLISNWDVQGMRWQANLVVRLSFQRSPNRPLLLCLVEVCVFLSTEVLACHSDLLSVSMSRNCIKKCIWRW